MADTTFRETMTSRERTVAALTGQPYDRIPVNLLMSDYAARVIGVTVGEYQQSARLMARGQIAAWHRYGMDLVNTGPGLTGIAEAMGSTLVFPDNTAHVSDFAVKDLADLDRLRIPDPERDGRLPLFLEAADSVLAEIGDRVPVSLTTSAPFTLACNLRGTEFFLRDLRKNPEFAHRLLRLATESIIAFGRAAIGVGVRIGLAEPTASGTLISPKLFREFALPYLKEVITRVGELAGANPSLHICGATNRIWQDMVDTGASVLSLDDEVDLAEARISVGDRVALLGNIRPTSVMVLGTPEDVRANVLECLVKGVGSPKGFILGMGCALPINTPPENIHALMVAAREYGRWPLHADRLTAGGGPAH
jgi:uroporphyrinogen decarboxylase